MTSKESIVTEYTSHTGRRKFLKTVGAGSLVSVAGCVGLRVPGSSSGASASEGFIEASNQIDFAQNLRDRRLATNNEWPIKRRQDVPSRGSDTSWKNFGSYETAPWSPPEGWKDTPAGEVDELGFINHGAATMEFDPATLATIELFQEKTGININLTEVGVTQANQQEQQILRAEQSTPEIMVVNGALVPQFVRRGYLKPVDALYPSQNVWDMYVPGLREMVQWNTDPTRKGAHEYGFPNIGEVTLGHLRADLVREQGLDPQRFRGEWSFELLEELMRAFEDTGVFAYAYYAGTPTYLSYSFRTLFYAQGGKFVQDDGTIRVDTPAAIRTTRKMAEWYQKGWVPSDVISFGEGSITNLFLGNQLAYATNFAGLLPLALEEYEAGKEYIAVLPPKATSGPNPAQRPLLGPNATTINAFSDTAHSLAALLFGDLRLSYTSQWWEYTFEGNTSFIPKVYEDASQSNFTPFADVFGSAVENAFTELFPQMQNLFTQMATPIQDAIQGRRTPKQAMQDIQEWVDANMNQEDN